MISFATAEPTGPPRTKHAPAIALFYASIVAVMAVAQLFGFEKFIPLLQQYQLPGGLPTGTLVACVLVICEVFALPFLLRLYLSPLMRVTSMLCGWLVPVLWLGLTLRAMAPGVQLDTVGLLGASIPLPTGWWAVLTATALGVLAGWASWGLWPGLARRKQPVK